MKTLQAKFAGAVMLLAVTGIAFAKDTHRADQASESPTASS